MTPTPAPAGLLGRVRIDATTKGFPPTVIPVPLLEAGAQRWTLDDLVPPVLVLRASALEHNLALMAAYCERHGVGLAPHGKTSMAPQLWQRQLEAGAWGITASTAAQAGVMRAARVSRILIANEVIDRSSIRWVAADRSDGTTELVCYVDSVEGIRALEEGFGEAGAPGPLAVLVELGYQGGRTGCRDVADAIELARAVRRSPVLELAGVAGFEGTMARDRTPESLGRIRAFLDELRVLAERLTEEGAFDGVPIVSAGGSRFFDVVVERLSPLRGRADVLLRSGCYLTHDSGIYAEASPFADGPDERRFRPAMEAWGAVLSIPEDGLAIVGLGRRDVPFDQGYPGPILVRRRNGETAGIEGAEIVALDDQHAYCRLRAGVALEPGDLVMCGISHPCTAFDRWRVIPVLDDRDRVIDAVATFF